MRMKHRWLALVLALGIVGLAACAPPGGAPGSSASAASESADPSGMDHSMAPGGSMSAAPSAEESEEEYEY
jgi:hypothetical protein